MISNDHDTHFTLYLMYIYPALKAKVTAYLVHMNKQVSIKNPSLL